MHKIPANLENPIDNIIYYFVEILAPLFYKMGFTPNMITTIGNICTIISIYYFLKNKFKFAAIFFFLSYFFDCLDGYVARSYNMISEFGDFYDHISDAIKSLSFLLLFILKSKKFAIIIIPILGILITLMGFHLANQEIYYGKPESSKTLQLFISLTNAKTREEASNNMKISKYFGCGTIVLIMTIIIALYKKSR
tara:strand:- start:49229 stop:49813 length:585 start_codon:yes stop_codon:yes gene_type:complete